jgi:hypothetical protein
MSWVIPFNKVTRALRQWQKCSQRKSLDWRLSAVLSGDVEQSDSEAKHLPVSKTEIKNMQSVTSTLRHVYKA